MFSELDTDLLSDLPGDLIVSKQKVRRAEAVACVGLKRQRRTRIPGSLRGPSCSADWRSKNPPADSRSTNGAMVSFRCH
jgi:hypothetical protein